VDVNDIPTRISIQKTNQLLEIIATILNEGLIRNEGHKMALRECISKINKTDIECSQPIKTNPILQKEKKEIYLRGRDITHIYDYYYENKDVFENSLTVYLSRKDFLRIWREKLKNWNDYCTRGDTLSYTSRRPAKYISYQQTIDISLNRPDSPNICVAQDIYTCRPYIKVTKE